MDFDEFERRKQFEAIWSAVDIARPVHFSLFTFGESVLPYYLVCGEADSGDPVTVRKGQVRIKRPMIITPDNARPEFRNFFEDTEEEGIAEFVLARSAQFSNLHLDNESGPKEVVSDGMEAAVAKLNRKLDNEEEEHVAILTAPSSLAGVAVLKYAAERVWKSGPDNVQELRERGFLPDL